MCFAMLSYNFVKVHLSWKRTKLKRCKSCGATDNYYRYPRVKLDATADISGKETSGRGGKGELLLRARKSFNR